MKRGTPANHSPLEDSTLKTPLFPCKMQAYRTPSPSLRGWQKNKKDLCHDSYWLGKLQTVNSPTALNHSSTLGPGAGVRLVQPSETSGYFMEARKMPPSCTKWWTVSVSHGLPQACTKWWTVSVSHGLPLSLHKMMNSFSFPWPTKPAQNDEQFQFPMAYPQACTKWWTVSVSHGLPLSLHKMMNSFSFPWPTPKPAQNDEQFQFPMAYP